MKFDTSVFASFKKQKLSKTAHQEGSSNAPIVLSDDGDDDLKIRPSAFSKRPAVISDAKSEDNESLDRALQPLKRKAHNIANDDYRERTIQPLLYYFEKNGLIFMDAVQTSETTISWRRELSKRSSAQWFEELKPFIPAAVKTVFDHDRPPTTSELRSLSFFGEDMGVYGDILTPKSSSSDLPEYLYPGVATHRPAKLRKMDHNSPKKLAEQPESKYYRLKHQSSQFKSHFISFARIQIDGRMTEEEISRRRMLCRIAEAFFTVATKAINSSHPKAANLSTVAERAFQKAYGDVSAEGLGAVQTEWLGLASHSPLNEQLGTDDYGTVAKSRYEETLEAYAELFDGKENIPDDWEQKAASRSRYDGPLSRQRRTQVDRQRNDAATLALNAAKNKERRQGLSEEEREESARYHNMYHENMIAAMNQNEKKEFDDKAALNTRKYRVMRAFNTGLLTQSQVDAAAANRWYEQPGWPDRWSRAPPKSKQNK